MERPASLTDISKLGEFGLIQRLTRLLPPPHPDVLAGIGDDAAVIRLSDRQALVTSTDMLCEGVHFDLAYVPLRHLGYKTVAVNVSDVYAMNARPFALTLSIAFSNRFSVEALEELYRGISAACEEYGIDLVGGDTSSSKAGLVLSASVFGLASPDEVIYRSGARENDLICVSGDLGAAYAGLQVLEREKSVFLENPGVQPDLVAYEYVVGRQLKPHARLDLYDIFQSQGIRPTSMIDISDGLASEIHHLCKASGTGAILYQDRLPIDPRTAQVAEEFHLQATHFALYGGEDYELLFTIRPQDYERLKAYPGLHVIGHITEPQTGVRLVLADQSVIALEPLGYNHFSAQSKGS